MAAPPTDRPRPVFARFYAWLSPQMEAEGMGELRDELLAGVAGPVVEVGAGNGLNLARYPASVDEVVAVEPEPYLRERAEQAARPGTVPDAVPPGTADELPLEDASVDVGVVSLMLCSVDDAAGALAELRRVIRPGGELRFLEHVEADTPGLRRVQRFADATVWPLLAGGCHTSRDTLTEIEAAGFEVEVVRHLRFPGGSVPVPADPHVLGRARRPG